MQKRLDPILRKHKVDIYACGHIHNFQHLRVPGSDIDYVVNSAGSLSRKVKPVEGTQFCSPEPVSYTHLVEPAVGVANGWRSSLKSISNSCFFSWKSR